MSGRTVWRAARHSAWKVLAWTAAVLAVVFGSQAPADASNPPDTSIVSPPDGSTVASPTVTVTLGGTDDATQPELLDFACVLDGAAIGNCNGVDLSSLSEGSHILTAAAIDGELNQDPTPASSTFTVDLPDPPSAAGLAAAMSDQQGLVTGASFVEIPPGIGGVFSGAVGSATVGGFPRSGASYGVLSSGTAQLSDPSLSYDLGTGPIRGNSDFDVTIMRIDVHVPQGDSCLAFDFRYWSEEFPEFVGSSFNDAFIAELDASTWTTSGSVITAPGNFAFDAGGDVISINSSGVTSMSASEAQGTAFGGATALLTASAPVTAGPHSLFLSIFDQGDGVLDSAVAVDSLRTGTTQNACSGGATAVTSIVAVADTASTTVDTPVGIDVLANDTGLGAQVVAVSVSGPPASGSAVVQPDGSITYTPSAGFSGADQFTYAVNGSTALVTVTVNSSGTTTVPPTTVPPTTVPPTTVPPTPTTTAAIVVPVPTTSSAPVLPPTTTLTPTGPASSAGSTPEANVFETAVLGAATERAPGANDESAGPISPAAPERDSRPDRPTAPERSEVPVAPGFVPKVVDAGFTLRPGGGIGFAAAGAGNCDRLVILLDGSPIGAVRPNDRGEVDLGSVDVPGDTSAGSHTLSSTCGEGGEEVHRARITIVPGLHRTALVTELVSLDEANTSAGRLLASLGFGAGVLALLTAAGALLPAGSGGAASAAGGARLGSLVTVFGALAVGGAVAVRAGGAGADESTLAVAVGLGLGLLVLAIVFAGGRLIRPLPVAVAAALGAAVVGPAIGLVPGFVFGALSGYALRDRWNGNGRAHAVALGGALLLSVAAWLGWSAVAAASADGGGFLLYSAEATLATIFVGGVQTTLVGLLPVGGFPGRLVLGHSRAVWSTLVVLAAASWVQLLGAPAVDAIGGSTSPTAVLLTAAALGCVAAAVAGRPAAARATAG